MRLLVIDGNSVVNRAYYGIRPLTTKDGQPTQAIYGFLTMLHRIQKDEQPDAVAVAFDLKAPTFRHKAYSGYKANRKGMPDDLACQLPVLRELLGLLGYRIVTCEGYEADDILGTFARTCEENGNECVLATGDRDSLQLVSELVTVHFCSNREDIRYTPERIMLDYGVTPKELIEIKALQGDSSDNIPGVAGIGKKGAGDLIGKYHSIEYIYSHIDELDIKAGIKNKLVLSKDNAFLSRMLGEICTSVPVETDINQYAVECADPAAAARYMARLELFSLIDKYVPDSARAAETDSDSAEAETLKIDEAPDADGLLARLRDSGKAYFKFEDNGGDVRCAVADNGVIYLCGGEFPKKLLSDGGIKKYVCASKPAFAYAYKNGIEAKGIVFDIELAAYLLEPSAKSYSDFELCAANSIGLPHAEKEEYKKYEPLAVYDILCEKLLNEIKANGQEKLLEETEIPLAGVLAEMECTGFGTDRRGIEEYGKMLSQRIAALESDIYAGAGCEFNINSPKQLGTVLFEKLGLPCKKKTKSGYSTSAEVLDSLRYEHPVVDMVLNYRTLSKLNSTYCEGLLKVIDSDGRIRSSFNQTETRTGRISSAEPNLQNIPVRTQLGREMRRFFRAGEGRVLVDADYSQIELRVLAHISNDKNMTEAFRQGIDIHAVTASQVFNMPLDMVTPVMRSRAKAVNFGIVYGMGAFSLAKDIGVTNREAKSYIESYLAHYSGVDEYMKRTVERAKLDGYVETMFGRRRYLPELSSGKHALRAFGERVARNMPIQGTAADIIKIAMVRVSNRLKREKMESRLILQVHDELIVEAPESEAEKAAAILQEEMENAVSLSVPLVAEASVGRTWYDAKG